MFDMSIRIHLQYYNMFDVILLHIQDVDGDSRFFIQDLVWIKNIFYFILFSQNLSWFDYPFIQLHLQFEKNKKRTQFTVTLCDTH